MSAYPRILFPVDLSEQSKVVAEHVATMVEKFHSELHMVHVIARYEGPTFSSVTDVFDQIKDNAHKEMDEFAAAHFPNVKQVQTSVLIGHSGRQILGYIKNHDISLVVMGTHGRSGLGAAFFGSVAQRVVQSAKVPVLTVHPVR
ncbi:MAG: universal stress protein [Deltaproteobacteria bacterium]|nr:universal stress protein [Deltaproteobacteria bacterium]